MSSILFFLQGLPKPSKPLPTSQVLNKVHKTQYRCGHTHTVNSKEVFQITNLEAWSRDKTWTSRTQTTSSTSPESCPACQARLAAELQQAQARQEAIRRNAERVAAENNARRPAPMTRGIEQTINAVLALGQEESLEKLRKAQKNVSKGEYPRPQLMDAREFDPWEQQEIVGKMSQMKLDIVTEIANSDAIEKGRKGPALDVSPKISQRNSDLSNVTAAEYEEDIADSTNRVALDSPSRESCKTISDPSPPGSPLEPSSNEPLTTTRTASPPGSPLEPSRNEPSTTNRLASPPDSPLEPTPIEPFTTTLTTSPPLSIFEDEDDTTFTSTPQTETEAQQASWNEALDNLIDEDNNTDLDEDAVTRSLYDNNESEEHPVCYDYNNILNLQTKPSSPPPGEEETSVSENDTPQAQDTDSGSRTFKIQENDSDNHTPETQDNDSDSESDWDNEWTSDSDEEGVSPDEFPLPQRPRTPYPELESDTDEQLPEPDSENEEANLVDTLEPESASPSTPEPEPSAQPSRSPSPPPELEHILETTTTTPNTSPRPGTPHPEPVSDTDEQLPEPDSESEEENTTESTPSPTPASPPTSPTASIPLLSPPGQQIFQTVLTYFSLPSSTPATTLITLFESEKLDQACSEPFFRLPRRRDSVRKIYRSREDLERRGEIRKLMRSVDWSGAWEEEEEEDEGEEEKGKVRLSWADEVQEEEEEKARMAEAEANENNPYFPDRLEDIVLLSSYDQPSNDTPDTHPSSQPSSAVETEQEGYTQWPESNSSGREHSEEAGPEPQQPDNQDNSEEIPIYFDPSVFDLGMFLAGE